MTKEVTKITVKKKCLRLRKKGWESYVWPSLPCPLHILRGRFPRNVWLSDSILHAWLAWRQRYWGGQDCPSSTAPGGNHTCTEEAITRTTLDAEPTLTGKRRVASQGEQTMGISPLLTASWKERITGPQTRNKIKKGKIGNTWSDLWL